MTCHYEVDMGKYDNDCFLSSYQLSDVSSRGEIFSCTEKHKILEERYRQSEYERVEKRKIV